MKRLLFALGALALASLWQAPASIVDQCLDDVSGGTLRLAEATGTVWSGRALLLTAGKSPGVWQPQLPIEWTLDASSLVDRRLALRISSGGNAIATIGAGFDGIVANRVRLRGPASFFLERFKHNLSHAGWRGEMAMTSTRFECTWNGHCGGPMEVEWINASSDLLLNQPLGSYRLTTDGVAGGVLRFQLRTIDGTIRIDGGGDWAADGSFSFKGTIKGPPELMQRLPSIAGPWAQPSDEAGTWTIAIARGPLSSRKN